ncbi:unnamed protein product [Nippostrongylus brasiliensis]|uniref:Uncharacterized protein n=1 Tax=Nippostrongylus brasiliensis TaxID=27835 RepID=A0A0N4YJR0_NIPBR|nr:unnamed protein product [Nippostrongylus brasiliensis]
MMTGRPMEKHGTSHCSMMRRICVKTTASVVTNAHSKSPVCDGSMRGSSMQGRHRGVPELVHNVRAKLSRSKKDNIEGQAREP